MTDLSGPAMTRNLNRRWVTIAAAVGTILMALLNLPAGLSPHDAELPVALAWAATALGVAGIIAATALLRRMPWGRATTIAVGALNGAGGIWALAAGHGNGVVGLVLGLGAAALAWVAVRAHSRVTSAGMSARLGSDAT